MADVYVEVGPMAVNKDTNKVDAKYANTAKKTMREAAVKAVKSAQGFTPDKTGSPKGFYFDATLTEVKIGPYQGKPSVTCKVSGILATFPERKMISSSLTGEATVPGGTSAGDVEFCLKAVINEMVTKRVLPALKSQPKP